MNKQSNWISSRALCLEKLIIASRASILFIFNVSDSFTRFIDSGAEYKIFFVRFARDFAEAYIQKRYRGRG